MEEIQTESSNSNLSFFVEKDKVKDLVSKLSTGKENQTILENQKELITIVRKFK